MNVYDFDGTIYKGDSSIDFFCFCAKKNLKVLTVMPEFFIRFVQYKCGKITKEKLKSSFFSFVRFFPDIDFVTEEFWKCSSKKIAAWYLMQKRENDIIISASPDFLLKKISSQLGTRLIATHIEKTSGILEEKNCFGKEKVSRFQKEFGKETVENFYSDSKTDFPLAQIALNAWLVKNGTIKRWETEKHSDKQNEQNKVFQVFLYIFFGAATVCVNTVLYALFRTALAVRASSVLAWFFAVVFAYFTNKFFVFKTQKTQGKAAVREAVLFLAARVLSEAVELVLLPVLLTFNSLSQKEVLIKILVNVLVIILNYLASKIFIFK
ncbi:HAD-IB family phosphatase [Treponema sp.]|uniref:HAD-IB family phosphatase n=1 Tax=Treponema sp. TaxID=166 RepID=UPI003EFEBF14